MVIAVALLFIAVAGFAAYACLRVNRINTAGDERLAVVLAVALTLASDPQGAPAEFGAELVGLATALLGLASIAHLARHPLRAAPRESSVG